MALPDPTINPPLLPRPGASTPSSRSPSISHVCSGASSPSSPTLDTRRRLQSVSQDPILRNLSPTKTLRALNNSSHTDTEAGLMKSVGHVSDEDRAFGVRVAQTCKDLREWAVEVEAWEWPGTFEPPSSTERASRRRRMLAEHHVPPSHLSGDSDDDEEAFWGSLPKELVLSYEARIDTIHSAMEDMDVEGLKNHVRNVHILPKSKSPKQDEFISFRVRSVDDYTTLITATILQALPYLSWLTRLLNEWSIRLLILRKVPGFLSGLTETQKQLEMAWNDLSLERHHSKESASPVRHRFESMQTVLGSKVSALGQRLDSMLDELEGRSETLPDNWIDRFESLELAYSNWVVKAERMLTGLAWEFDLPSTAASTPGYDALGILTEPQNPSDTVGLHELEAIPATRLTDDVSKGGRRVESPTLGERPWDGGDSTTTLGEPQVRLRQDSEFTRLVDDVILESQDQATSPVIDDHADPSVADLATMRGSTIPPEGPKEERQTPSPAKSPRVRARHVPIQVEAYREAATKAGITPHEEEEEPYSLNREPPLPAPTENERPSMSTSSVAARRAVFSGELETKQILLKASSPVRPFEHASTAFTKLFKASSSKEPSRAGSSASKNTLKKKPTPRSVKSRTSFSSKRASDQSLDVSSSRGRIKRALEGTVSDNQEYSRSPERIEATETAGSDSPERRLNSAPQNKDWSDKEVIAPRPLSEDSPALNLGRFDSPLTQGRVSDHWPFPSGSKTADDEISSPGGAIRSDDFEQMFVDTLPVSPILDEVYASNLATFDDYINRVRRGSAVTESSLHDDMVDGVYNLTMEGIKGKAARRKPRSRRGRQQQSEGRITSGGHDSISVVRSQNSTPEIHDASAAGFFKPHEVTTPRKHRGKKSRRDKYGVKSPTSSRKHPEAPDNRRVFIDGDNDADRSASDKEAIKSPRVANKRASVAALEETAQAEDDTRRPSTADSGTTQMTSYFDASFAPSPSKSRDRSDTTQSEPVFPMPPAARSGHLRTRSAKDKKSMLQALRSDSERSMVGHRLGATKPPPLAFGGLSHPLPPRGPETFEDDRLETHAEEARPATPVKSEKRRDSISSANGDYIDRHVSEVLRKMTSNIHFSTHSGRITPRANTPSQGTGQTPVKRRPRDGFTLAPANPNQPSLKMHVKDGETKLYHLSQPGKEQPIKLFIRLVGDDERAMVRVGGGWMDLEDYLRQYAEHHTHRAVGGGAIEVTEASRVNSEKKKTPDGRHNRPESALSFKFGSMQSPDLSSSPLERGAMSSTPDAYALDHPTISQQSTPFSESFQSPSSQPSTYFDTRITPSRSIDTPSKVESSLRHNPLFPKIVDPPTLSRPNSIGSEIRTTPSAVKTGLDAQKARWVEDMIAKARQSAGEKGKENKKKDWQELGKSGGTRRMAAGSWRDHGRNANKW